jgi:hypothetical protein
LQDDSGKEVGYLYSLLEAEGSAGGASAQKDSGDSLTIGTYNCYVGEQGAGQMRITGKSTYESEGKRGTYRLESSGKIVFESGPFSGFNSKLLSGRRIGLNLSGGTFYNMTCEPPR